MRIECNNCSHFTNKGYKDEKQTEHLGFCNRFKCVTAKIDQNCIGFNTSTEKADYFKNLLEAKKLKINLLNPQLNLF